MATVEQLMTADEFALMPDDGKRTELIRGRIVEMNMPGFRHGEVCRCIATILGAHVRKHRLGRVACNDVGVRTLVNPDSVRGADVCYFSYQRLPKDDPAIGYPLSAPELVFEVLSPTDRRSESLRKTAEYLDAGVIAVCVVDPQTETATIYVTNAPERLLTGADLVEFPNILPGFKPKLSDFFET